MNSNNKIKPKIKVKKDLVFKKIETAPKAVVSVPKMLSTSVDWAKGLVDPFSANGPRVPDMFCYPTVTGLSKGVQVVNSDSAGTILGALLPYPTISYIGVAGATSSSNMLQYTGKPVFAATTQPNLAAMFSNYRVVSVGLRVRNLIAPLSATGRVIIAPFISANSVPGPNWLGNVNASAIDGGVLFGSVTGLPSTSPNLLELPYAKEYSIQDLISGTVCWSTRPVSSESYHFHGVNTTKSNSFISYGGSIGQDTGTGALYTNLDNADQYLPNNYTGVIISAVGLPASIPALELEYVYHYEGTPSMGLTSGSLMPEAATPSPVDISSMSTLLRGIVNSDPVNLIAETTLGSIGKMAMNFLKKL